MESQNGGQWSTNGIEFIVFALNPDQFEEFFNKSDATPL
jgi:hypothetical protein